MAWKLLCIAANSGLALAQSEVAHWHTQDAWAAPTPKREWVSRAGVRPDDRLGYMWYTLAADNGAADALEIRDYAARRLDKNAVEQARHLAQEWEPGQCPRPSR